MIIEKKQKDKKRFVFNWSFFNSARAGLKYILQTKELRGKIILVPAYIGYSTKEGSGVFDPIRETRTRYVFYGMDKNLNINIKDLKTKIRENPCGILLFIHYFGFPDKELENIKQYAGKYGMTIIEDFAHAFFTFWLDPVINFDYGIFSIHKLFPADSGGMVLSKKVINNKSIVRHDLFNYDMKNIMQRRIENYNHILHRFRKKFLPCNITVLRKELAGAVPHSFPLLLPDKGLRDRLYFRMNKEGYGVISLYHTLVREIDDSFAVEHGISGRILNLPVHQDAEKKDLDRMIDKMSDIVKAYEKE